MATEPITVQNALAAYARECATYLSQIDALASSGPLPPYAVAYSLVKLVKIGRQMRKMLAALSGDYKNWCYHPHHEDTPAIPGEKPAT